MNSGPRFLPHTAAGTFQKKTFSRQIREGVDFGNGWPTDLAACRRGCLLLAWKKLPAPELKAALGDCDAEFLPVQGRLPFANRVQAFG